MSKSEWRSEWRGADVRPSDREINVAELHWFECHGRGRKEFKIKKVLR